MNYKREIVERQKPTMNFSYCCVQCMTSSEILHFINISFTKAGASVKFGMLRAENTAWPLVVLREYLLN